MSEASVAARPPECRATTSRPSGDWFENRSDERAVPGNAKRRDGFVTYLIITYYQSSVKVIKQTTRSSDIPWISLKGAAGTDIESG